MGAKVGGGNQKVWVEPDSDQKHVEEMGVAVGGEGSCGEDVDGC